MPAGERCRYRGIASSKNARIPSLCEAGGPHNTAQEKVYRRTLQLDRKARAKRGRFGRPARLARRAPQPDRPTALTRQKKARYSRPSRERGGTHSGATAPRGVEVCRRRLCQSLAATPNEPEVELSCPTPGSAQLAMCLSGARPLNEAREASQARGAHRITVCDKCAWAFWSPS